jgi:SnoaL-like protein
MEPSDAVREGVLRFFEAFEVAHEDPGAFDRVVSSDAVGAIGSAPHEWIEGREAMRRQFGMEGVTIDPGEEIEAYREGSLGFATGRPSFVLGEMRLPVRFSAVLVEEEDAWKVVHLHASVGLPDDEAITAANADADADASA